MSESRIPFFKRGLEGITLLAMISAIWTIFDSESFSKYVLEPIFSRPEYIRHINIVKLETKRLRDNRLREEWIPLVKSICEIIPEYRDLEIGDKRDIVLKFSEARQRVELSRKRLGRIQEKVESSVYQLSGQFDGEDVESLATLILETYEQTSGQIDQNIDHIRKVEKSDIRFMTNADLDAELDALTGELKNIACDYQRKLILASGIMSCAIHGLEKLRLSHKPLIPRRCRAKIDEWENS